MKLSILIPTTKSRTVSLNELLLELKRQINYDPEIEIFKHFKKGTLEQSATFGHGGNRNSKYFVEKTFGFHRNWAQIDFKTGLIDYSDTSKTLNASYDHEIEKIVYGIS